MAKVEKSTFASEQPQMTILSDHHSQSPSDDFLSMESRLSVVLDILRHRHTRCPTTIAIYGDWGTGKTSAMHWLESQLDEWNMLESKKRGEHPRVYPVWFDPWKYHSREDVWRGIIAEVILSLFRVSKLDRQNFRTRITEAAKKFGAFLGKSFLHALARTEVKVKAEGGAPGIVKGETEFSVSGEMFQDIYDEYERANHPEKAHLNQFEDTLRTWVEGFLKTDERIALFIDDLDRCMPEVTLEVLEAIKLYLNIPQIMFVVGVDRDVVDKIAIKHYESHGLSESKARQYLDKIFQVEIQIPPSEQQMKGFLDKQVEALNQSTGGYWKANLDEDHRQALETGIRELARHNPRETKRLLNSALLRGRAAADNPSFRQKRRQPLLFAQGVQLFLIQRIIHNWIINGRNLLREEETLEWFEKWSELAIKFPGFKPPVREAGNDAAKLSKQDDQQLSEEAKAYEGLKDVTLIGDDLKAVDKLLLLEDVLLWDLLRIPFSVEVAQSAPKLESAKPSVSSKAEQKTDASESEAAISLLSSVILNRIGKQLGKPVDQVTWSEVLDVRELDLSKSEVTDSDLRQVAALKHIQRLDLTETKITDSGLESVAKLQALEELILWSTKITDAGLKHVAKLPSLLWLDLTGTKIGESGLGYLSNISSLKILDLRTVLIKDAGLVHLTKLSGLRHLYLSGWNITVDGLSHLASFTSLEYLGFWNSDVLEIDGVKQLTKITSLRNLDLLRSNIADAGLEQLSSLSSLEVLRLEETKITNAGLHHLVKFSSLRDLSLAGTQITDAGLDYLAKLSSLRTLDISKTKTTKAGVANLHAKLKDTHIIR